MKKLIYKSLIIFFLSLSSMNIFSQVGIGMKLIDFITCCMSLDLETNMKHTPKNNVEYHTYQSKSGKIVLYFDEFDIKNHLTKAITSEYICFAYTRYVNKTTMLKWHKTCENLYQKLNDNIYLDESMNVRYTFSKINNDLYIIDMIYNLPGWVNMRD